MWPPTYASHVTKRRSTDEIVRMECTACGTEWFRPEGESAGDECPNCGAQGQIVAAHEDRRTVVAPVPEDRRTNVPTPPPGKEDLRTPADRRVIQSQDEQVDRAERRKRTPRRA